MLLTQLSVWLRAFKGSKPFNQDSETGYTGSIALRRTLKFQDVMTPVQNRSSPCLAARDLIILLL
jgi:hypothetical protein